MKIKVLAGALVASAALTGCASIFAGGPAKIDITSTPGDAAVTITNADGAVVFNGTTPTTAELTEKDLKAMGRDTIAGLIAGILQKYSHKKEVTLSAVLKCLVSLSLIATIFSSRQTDHLALLCSQPSMNEHP